MKTRFHCWLLPVALVGCDAGGGPAPDRPAASPRERAPTTVEAPRAPPTSESAPRTATALRCGWLHNPTPANWWLEDRDGQWILGTQGADQTPGMDEMPDMSVAGWIETNGHYGYGCACMMLTVDPVSRDVLRITAPEPKPLKQCRNDKALPDPMADAVG